MDVCGWKYAMWLTFRPREGVANKKGEEGEGEGEEGEPSPSLSLPPFFTAERPLSRERPQPIRCSHAHSHRNHHRHLFVPL
jgi:hypothetical protein